MVRDTNNKILTGVKHVAMYLRQYSSSWPSLKEPKVKGTQDHIHLSGGCNLVIVIQLKLKADPYIYLTKIFFLY